MNLNAAIQGMPDAARAGWTGPLPRRHAAPKIQLYGWDSPTASWHGPDELHYTNSAARRLADTLRESTGRSWYGPLKCLTPGEPATRFFAVIHDLGDCALAMLYCDESKAGPVEIVTVIPARRRAGLRAEFPFEFLTFTSFLHSNPGAELALHDRLTEAIAETGDTDSLVFAITTGLWASDQDYVLSRCVERVAIAMLRWLEES